MLRPLWVLVVSLILINSTTAKYIKGRVYTSCKWAFITRFLFSEEQGGLEYSVNFPASAPCCPSLAFYYSDFWSRVYPAPYSDCEVKMGYVFKSYDVSENFNSSKSLQCDDHIQDGGRFRRCSGKISFLTMVHRWWFLVVSQCNGSNPLDVTYEFTITNGDSWERQVSADESHMIYVMILFLLVFTVALIMGLIYGGQLAMSNFLHRPYKIFLISLAYEEVALIFETIYYVEYLQTGVQNTAIQTTGALLHAASETVFVILLILLAKGFTITRGRLPASTQIKLAIFTALYGIAYVIYFITETKFRDPGLVQNNLEDWAGVGVLALRVVGWSWFLYGVIQTVDKYPEKRVFYSWFCVLFSVWFMAKPGLIVYAYFGIEEWRREKIIKGVDLAVCAVGYIMILHLIRPLSANYYFPFHVRTNQINVVTTQETSDFPHTEEFSRMNKYIKGELETSLTDLKDVHERNDVKKYGISSAWFSGKH